MSLTDGCRCDSDKGRRTAETPELATRLLFKHIVPSLLAKNKIGKLISYIWKWMHVPNLECNTRWVKEGLCKFFEIHDARVVLSDHMTDGKRVHNVVKQFKKYATQSAVRTFKNHQKKEWGFTIEVNRYQNKDGSMPPCKEG